MHRFLHTRRVLSAVAVLAVCLLSPGLAAETEAEKDEIVLASGEEPSKDHVRPRVLLSVDRLPAGGTAKFAVVLDIENGWHINTNPARPDFVVPTTVAVKAKHGTKAEKIKYPEGTDLAIEGFDEPLSVYEGQVVLFGTLNVPKDAARQTEELTVEIKFQVCNDRQCLAPKTVKLKGKVPVAGQGEPVKAVNEKLFEKDEREKEGHREAA